MSLLLPAGHEQVRQRDLLREFLRFPTVVWLPASVTILVVVGLQSLLAAAPSAVALATAATIHALHRASARTSRRNAVSLVPQQRLANERAGSSRPDRIDVG
jgi:Flp pilus assembly protein TadB